MKRCAAAMRQRIPALDFESSFPYQVFSVQRGKAFWFHRRDRSCSDKNKPFSLPTDQTFLFLTEETLSGSTKETRPVLIRTNLLLFPRTTPLFFLPEETLSGSTEETRRVLYENKAPSFPHRRREHRASPATGRSFEVRTKIPLILPNQVREARKS